MLDTAALRALHGSTMIGEDGQKIGKVADVYEPAHDGGSWFATVHTGLFGGGSSFVPLDRATSAGDDLQVPYTKDFVKDAPHVDADAEISTAEEQEIYRYYGLGEGLGEGLGGGADANVTGAAPSTGAAAPAGAQDLSGPNTDDAMTRSEERLAVGTQQAETGRARLSKYIVTENVTQTVPVSHEEVRTEREPITEANRGAAYDGPALSEEVAEVTLHAEKPVVAKETVPVERVRLATETVTEQQQVNEQVRKEQIDTDGVHPADSSRETVREDTQR